MKIALASAQMVDGDIAHNLAQMERWALEAKKKGAQLVCFGETFLQGFGALSFHIEQDWAVGITTGSSLFRKLRELSSLVAIDLLFGYVEREGDSLYSSCALMQEGQLLYNYRRVSQGWKHYWRTDHHYREGDTVEVFSYRGKRCAIALCGDLWDNCAERFALGEDLLFWPVYISYTPQEWTSSAREEYAVQAGKICGHTLLINSLCSGDGYGGAAQFVNGSVQGELPLGQEGLLVVDV